MNSLRNDLIISVPGLLLLGFGFLIPVTGILVLGLRDAEGGWTAVHLLRFLTDPFYLGIAWRTVKLSLVITAICIVTGVPLAYIMARGSPRLRLWLIICITLPLMTSVVVRTFGWMVILGRGGVIPDLMNKIVLVNRNYTLMHTETAIVAGMVQVLFPFMVLSILGVVLRIDQRLEEAARVMGCSFLEALRLVILPRPSRGSLRAPCSSSPSRPATSSRRPCSAERGCRSSPGRSTNPPRGPWNGISPRRNRSSCCSASSSS